MIRRLKGCLALLPVLAAVSMPLYADDAESLTDKATDAQSGSKATGCGYDSVKLNMVSDTVSAAFTKANAILTGNLDIRMGKRVQGKDDYTTDAMGMRVPKRTAIKTGAALHSDQPL